MAREKAPYHTDSVLKKTSHPLRAKLKWGSWAHGQKVWWDSQVKLVRAIKANFLQPPNRHQGSVRSRNELSWCFWSDSLRFTQETRRRFPSLTEIPAYPAIFAHSKEAGAFFKLSKNSSFFLLRSVIKCPLISVGSGLYLTVSFPKLLFWSPTW